MVSGGNDLYTQQARRSYAMGIYSTMEDLNDANYMSWMRWKNGIQLVILLHDLDFALDEDEPEEPTDTSSPEEKAKYEKWERSNRLSLLLIESKMSKSLYSYLVHTNTTKSCNAKQVLAALEGMVMDDERIEAPRMLKELVNMRYNGQDNVRLHLGKMASFARRLRAVDVGLPDYLINRLALDSLPSEFDDVRFLYIVEKEKWGLDEITKRCGHIEDLLRLEDDDNPMLGKRGRTGNANENSKDQQRKGRKKRRNVECRSCGKEGHLAKNCWQ